MFKLETLESKVMAEWATVWSKTVHFFLILSSVHVYGTHTIYWARHRSTGADKTHVVLALNPILNPFLV